MGVRSDVGIAMKEYVYQNLSVKAKEFLTRMGPLRRAHDAHLRR
jgi:hypothetical protein